MTTVVQVNAKAREEWEADPSFVYVGRAARGGWKNSIWGNPFKVSRDSLMFVGPRPPAWTPAMKRIATQQAVAMFAGCVMSSDIEPWTTMRARLHELCGKTLGCWCGDWKPGDPEILCHAVVLAKLANALEVQ